MSQQPSIGIVGGAMAGLSLLATLKRLDVPATVTLYERDASATVRSHLGGTLDIHYDTGMRCIRENGLSEAFDKVSRPEGEEVRVYQATGDGALLHHKKGPSGKEEQARPEVDRKDLRKILMDACDAGSIKWGHGVDSVRPVKGSHQHELVFPDGSTATHDLVVGADGAWSRVRRILSDTLPRYTGMNGLEVSFPPSINSDPAAAHLVEKIGHGMALAFSKGGKMIAWQRNSDGRIRTYVWQDLPEDWSPPTNAEDAKAFVRRTYSDWQPWMIELFNYIDPAAIYHRPLYTLPTGWEWPHRKGVTIIGDAATLMPPNGEGANLALAHGLDLGVVIDDALRSGGDLDAAIKAYETQQSRRAAAAAEEAAQGQMLGEDAEEAMDTFNGKSKPGDEAETKA